MGKTFLQAQTMKVMEGTSWNKPLVGKTWTSLSLKLMPSARRMKKRENVMDVPTRRANN